MIWAKATFQGRVGALMFPLESLRWGAVAAEFSFCVVFSFSLRGFPSRAVANGASKRGLLALGRLSRMLLLRSFLGGGSLFGFCCSFGGAAGGSLLGGS